MLTGRQSKILEILLNNVQGMTGAQLSERLEVSSRTIRNEIGEINRIWSEEESIIKASKRTGYYIEEKYQNSVREYFLTKNESETEENIDYRGWMILGILLDTGENDLYTIAENLCLSEQAVYKEIIKFRKMMMDEYQCKLLHISAERVWLDEDERKIRQTLFRVIKNETQKGIKSYNSFLKAVLSPVFEKEIYEDLMTLIKEYFDNKNIQVSDANLYMIVSAIYITMLRNSQGHSLRKTDDYQKNEFSSENKELFSHLMLQGIEIKENDLELLGELLHSFKLTQNPVKDSNIDALSTLILEEFCNEIMEKYHFDMWQSHDFYDNILIHIEYMLRRMETGYAVKNPLLNEIKKQYPYAYEISMLLVPIVYRYKNCYIQDDEISYIAIFVEHFLENVNQRLKAVIISSSRYSASTIVSNWLEMNFQNQIEVKAMIPLHNLDQFLEENQVDLIVSTMDTVVHPVIHTFRIEGIPNRSTQNAMNALVHKIRMNYRFRDIIKEYFDKKVIRIYKEKMEFEDVVRDLSEVLKKEDYIYDVNEYVEDILQREVNYPTCIGDWFMLPHPLVTFAKRTAIGVAVLKEPLHKHGKNIQLIFLLAMEPKQNEKIGILFQFFTHMALEKATIGMLSAVENEDEFLESLIKISNSTEIL